MIPPLAIIQARRRSTRIPEKMFARVGDKPVIRWAVDQAIACFGVEHVAVAVPHADLNAFAMVLDYRTAIFGWDGDENDVLGRIHACAHNLRDDPKSQIVRITPDDFPIDPYREICRLEELDRWHATVTEPVYREHIGSLFAPRLEINTLADLEQARARVQ